MAYGKQTLAINQELEVGAVGDGVEGSLVVQVENLGGGGSITVKGRSVGSGMARVQIDGYNINDEATKLAAIVANGVYKFPCGGLDVSLLDAVATADVATNFVRG